jgi:hypothetical protein
VAEREQDFDEESDSHSPRLNQCDSPRLNQVGSNERLDLSEDEGQGTPALAAGDIQTQFAKVPKSNVQHFFVDPHCSNPEVEEVVGCLDPDVSHPDSITRFLILPIVTQHSHVYSKDPVVNFAKSVILTSDEYVVAATRLKETREKAVKAKEQNKVQKEETRKRKAAEREEAATLRAAACFQAQRLKELRAAEQAQVRASRVAECEEAQRLKAQRLADVAAKKAIRAAKKTRQSTTRQQAQRDRVVKATETAEERPTEEELNNTHYNQQGFQCPRNTQGPLFTPIQQVHPPHPLHHFI